MKNGRVTLSPPMARMLVDARSGGEVMGDVGSVVGLIQRGMAHFGSTNPLTDAGRRTAQLITGNSELAAWARHGSGWRALIIPMEDTR